MTGLWAQFHQWWLIENYILCTVFLTYLEMTVKKENMIDQISASCQLQLLYYMFPPNKWLHFHYPTEVSIYIHVLKMWWLINNALMRMMIYKNMSCASTCTQHLLYRAVEDVYQLFYKNMLQFVQKLKFGKKYLFSQLTRFPLWFEQVTTDILFQFSSPVLSELNL